jgi:hypothetical protein
LLRLREKGTILASYGPLSLARVIFCIRGDESNDEELKVFIEQAVELIAPLESKDEA